MHSSVSAGARSTPHPNHRPLFPWSRKKAAPEGLSPAGVPQALPELWIWPVALLFTRGAAGSGGYRGNLTRVKGRTDALPRSAALKGAGRWPEPEHHSCWSRAPRGAIDILPLGVIVALATIVTTTAKGQTRRAPGVQGQGETWMSQHPFLQDSLWGRPADAPDRSPEWDKSPAPVGHPPLLPGPPRMAQPPAREKLPKGGRGHSPERTEGGERVCLPFLGVPPIFRAWIGYPGSGIIPETPFRRSSGAHRRAGCASKARLGRVCWAANNITTLLWSIRTNYPT